MQAQMRAVVAAYNRVEWDLVFTQIAEWRRSQLRIDLAAYHRKRRNRRKP